MSALKSTGLEFEAVVATEAYTYGETMHRYWQMGDTFINVEHDIVPYPGALEALDECEHEFCGYDYPIGHAGILGPGRGSALGCVKFDRKLMQDYPNLSRPWRYIPWNQLDAGIFTSLKDKIPNPTIVNTRWTHFCWHEHLPPVAHLDDFKDLTDQT